MTLIILCHSQKRGLWQRDLFAKNISCHFFSAKRAAKNCRRRAPSHNTICTVQYCISPRAPNWFLVYFLVSVRSEYYFLFCECVCFFIATVPSTVQYGTVQYPLWLQPILASFFPTTLLLPFSLALSSQRDQRGTNHLGYLAETRTKRTTN